MVSHGEKSFIFAKLTIMEGADKLCCPAKRGLRFRKHLYVSRLGRQLQIMHFDVLFGGLVAFGSVSIFRGSLSLCRYCANVVVV